MYIEEKYLEIVLEILKKYALLYEVWAFGSRVHGRNLKKFSDLDLVVQQKNNPKQKIDKKILQDLKNAFEESNIPYKVDIIDWAVINDDFKQIILKEYKILY